MPSFISLNKVDEFDLTLNSCYTFFGTISLSFMKSKMKKKKGFRLFFTVFSITIVASLICVFTFLIILKLSGTISQVVLGLVHAYTDTTQNLLPTSSPNTIIVYAPNPKIKSTSVPTAPKKIFPPPTRYAPPPTQYAERGWSQKDLAMNGFLVEIPDSWTIQEEIVSTEDICGLGKGLANYRLRDYGNYQELLLQFFCGPRGWADSYCPPETQILDEERGIVRMKMKPNEFEYLHFTRKNNTMQCVDGWNVTDQVVLMAYYNPDSTSPDQSKKDIFINAPLSVKKYVGRANISSFIS